MALIKCHECGAEVSTEAKACPKCGAKTENKMGCGSMLLIAIGTIAILSMTLGGGASSPNVTTPHDVAARQAEVEAEYARTPHNTPPLTERPLDQKAKTRAEKIPLEKLCSALGKALRAGDKEFTRAMIQRAADLQLGVLHLDEQTTIKKRQINIGMTSCMASAAWGYPEKVNRSVGTYGTHEQWVYPANYLYFEDGILTSWQD